MFFKGSIAALVAALISVALCAPACQDILIPVSVNALNINIPSNYNVANLTTDGLRSVLGLSSISVTGNYVIGATFCEPSTTVAKRRNTLQILIHGAGYTRSYWNGLGLNTIYSWVSYASKQGYPTLAIDRLCNGQSSHPNGLSVCQIPVESETVHRLVQLARAGTLPLSSSSRRAFSKIIVASHSVGSDVNSYLAQTHPSDSDLSIFAGWSNSAINGVPGVSYGNITPAYQVYPDRFGNLSSDPAYLTFASKSGQSYLSYYGSFVQSVQDYDYVNQGTFTLGEALTQLLGQVPAVGFRSPSLVLDGNEDATYCQPNPIASSQRAIGNCSRGNAANSRSSFPLSAKFQASITPNTGHCLNLHLTAQQSFGVAFDFLAKSGF